MATIPSRMVQFIGSTAEWQANDLILNSGEIGFEITSGGGLLMKVGDGATVFTGLPGIAVTAGTGGIYVPLAGTDDADPITGDLVFRKEDSTGPARIHHIANDFGGLDALALTCEGPNSAIIFTAKGSLNEDRGFAFSANGDFVINSASESDTNSWMMGSHNVLGNDNTFLILPVDAGGTTLAENLVIQTNPTEGTFVFQREGYLTLPRATGGGDPELAAATKGYVDAIIPEGGGEANTGSNLGSGEGEVFAGKSGVDLEHRTIKAGTDVTITQDAQEITISFTGGGGTDYIPLGGTDLGPGPVTGSIDISNNSSIHLWGSGGMQYGGVDGSPVFGVAYVPASFSLTWFGPTSGVAHSYVYQCWNGTTQKNLQINGEGQIISGTDAVPADNKALTTKKYVDDQLSGGVLLVDPPGPQQTNDDLTVVGATTALSFSATVGGLDCAAGVIAGGNIRADGNLSCGGGFATWGNTFNAVDIGNSGSVGAASSGSTYILNNAYFDGSNWKSRGVTNCSALMTYGGNTQGLTVQIDKTPGGSGTNVTWDPLAFILDSGITFSRGTTVNGTLNVTGASTLGSVTSGELNAGTSNLTCGAALIQGQVTCVSMVTTVGGGTFAGQVNLNAGNPTSAQHATRKSYVDAAVSAVQAELDDTKAQLASLKAAVQAAGISI